MEETRRSANCCGSEDNILSLSLSLENNWGRVEWNEKERKLLRVGGSRLELVLADLAWQPPATAIPSSAATDFQEYNDMQTFKGFAKVSLFHTLGHDLSNYILSTGYFEKELLLRPPPRFPARFSRVRLSQPARHPPPLYVVVNMQNLFRDLSYLILSLSIFI